MDPQRSEFSNSKQYSKETIESLSNFIIIFDYGIILNQGYLIRPRIFSVNSDLTHFQKDLLLIILLSRLLQYFFILRIIL